MKTVDSEVTLSQKQQNAQFKASAYLQEVQLKPYSISTVNMYSVTPADRDKTNFKYKHLQGHKGGKKTVVYFNLGSVIHVKPLIREPTPTKEMKDSEWTSEPHRSVFCSRSFELN